MRGWIFTAGVGTGLLLAFAQAVWTRSVGVASPDERLAARVRAAVTTVASRPSHLMIVADGGTVVLAGRAPAAEFEPLLDAVRAVRGVGRVVGQLSVFEEESESPEAIALEEAIELMLLEG